MTQNLSLIIFVFHNSHSFFILSFVQFNSFHLVWFQFIKIIYTKKWGYIRLITHINEMYFHEIRSVFWNNWTECAILFKVVNSTTSLLLYSKSSTFFTSLMIDTILSRIWNFYFCMYTVGNYRTRFFVG